jgi:hypothetical protein
MAGTRRTVERLGALLVSVTISMLVFRPLVMGKHSLVGFRGDGDDPGAVALLPLNSRIDSLATKVLSTPIDSVIEIKGVDDPPLPVESHDSFVSGYHDVPGAGYLPASMLTQRPIVLLDIHPELPASLQGVEPQFVDMLLLINTYGDVDQVLLESLPTLSASMVQELRQHFQVMRFMPGRWEGQAVPSALRIRVQLHP